MGLMNPSFSPCYRKDPKLNSVISAAYSLAGGWEAALNHRRTAGSAVPATGTGGLRRPNVGRERPREHEAQRL